MSKHARRGGRTHATRSCWAWVDGDRRRKNPAKVNCPWCVAALRTVGAR